MRFLASFSFALLVALLLYLPARYPPESFARALAGEHSINASAWGAERAERALRRAASFGAVFPAAGPAVARDDRSYADWARATAVGAAQAAVVRLANNSYARCVSSMLSLFLYRLLMLLELVPLFAPLLACCLVDGLVERDVRSHEFRAHNPTVFGFFKAVALAVLLLLPAAFTLPYPIPAPWVAAVPLLLAFSASRAVAHYYRTK